MRPDGKKGKKEPAHIKLPRREVEPEIGITELNQNNTNRGKEIINWGTNKSYSSTVFIKH